jgi:hypothetical protein
MNQLSPTGQGNLIHSSFHNLYLLSSLLLFLNQELFVDPSAPVESKASLGDPVQLPQKWAHAITMPEAGCVLVATEALDDDSIFERTVIFLLKLGSRGTFDGPFGVILNRPLYTKIKHEHVPGADYRQLTCQGV